MVRHDYLSDGIYILEKRAYGQYTCQSWNPLYLQTVQLFTKVRAAICIHTHTCSFSGLTTKGKALLCERNSTEQLIDSHVTCSLSLCYGTVPEDVYRHNSALAALV